MPTLLLRGVLLGLLLTTWSLASALAQADQPNIKIGLTYILASGGDYTLESTDE